MSDTPPSNDAPKDGGQAPLSVDDLKTVDQLPEWARDAITSANNEAARHRHAKKDAVTAAEAALRTEYDAKLTEAGDKYAELESTLTARELELVKLRTAIDSGVPNEAITKFATLLQGVNEDEIKSHADEVKELFKIKPPADKPVDYSQGNGGGTPPPLNGDPILHALKSAVGIR